MNTRKQVFLMSVLLMTMLVLVGVYGAWYPSREADATEHFADLTSERGAAIFSQNCRLCHGDSGEGGAIGGRLAAAPALDRPDLQGFVDSKATLTAQINSRVTEVAVSNGGVFKDGQKIYIDQEILEIEGIDGNTLHVKRGIDHSNAASHPNASPVLMFDQAALDQQITLITNTITCGRVGTAMQPWAQTQGGPLSAEQIRQLMTLITENRWDLVPELNDHADTVETHLTDPVNESDTFVYVADLAVFTVGDAIRIGDERMEITGVQNFDRNAADRSGFIQVERGALNSVPTAHDVEEEIFKFPQAPDPASINQSSCGQTARPAAPAGDPETIEDFTGQTVEVIARGVAFDKREITASRGASEQIRIRLENQDEGVEHNIAFYQSSTSTAAPLAPGSIGLTFAGPGVDDTVFTLPEAGSYFFRCDVHPTTMTGTFTVSN